MEKPLPEIYCSACNLKQPYRGQANCLHCGLAAQQLVCGRTTARSR